MTPPGLGLKYCLVCPYLPFLVLPLVIEILVTVYSLVPLVKTVNIIDFKKVDKPRWGRGRTMWIRFLFNLYIFVSFFAECG